MIFDAQSIPIDGLSALAKHLKTISSDPARFVIRGELREGIDGKGVRRRYKGSLAAFESADRQWLCIDLDDIELPDKWADFNHHVIDCIKHAISLLLPEFQGIDCFYQFSSSMGMKNGFIKLHLWYWLDRKVSDKEARAWLSQATCKVDFHLYSPVQPHYTCNPIFDDGIEDPVTQRTGIYNAGQTLSVVKVPDDLSVQVTKIRQQSTGHGGGGDGGSQEIERNSAGLVTDGRERWLFRQSVEAARELFREYAEQRKTGLPSTYEIAQRTWALFTATTDLTDDKWQYHDAVEKAAHRTQDLEERWDPRGQTAAQQLFPGVPAYYDTELISLSDGEQRLDAELKGFFDACRSGADPKLALRITMGLGKTSQMIKHLADLLKFLPLRVAIYTPRHDLAADISEKLTGENISVQVYHVKGRSHNDEHGARLCQEYDFVQELEKLGMPIRPNVCYQDEIRQCRHYQDCGYWKQFPIRQKSGVWVYPHAYLGLPSNEQMLDPHIVIIDESFVSSLLKRDKLQSGQIRQWFKETDKPTVGRILIDALEDGEPVLQALRQASVTPQWLRSLNHTMGVGHRDPNWTEQKWLKALEDADVPLKRRMKALCEVLADELETHSERVGVCRVRYDSKKSEVVIDHRADLQIPSSAAILLLDATVDETILNAVIPGVETAVIDVEQNAIVTQVYDRTGSNQSWGTEDKVQDLVVVLNARAESGEKILVVSHKKLADELREKRLPDNVSIAHFGALRGTNKYEDCETIFITGRNQPPQQDVDGKARALFWRDDEPLNHDEAASINADSQTNLYQRALNETHLGDSQRAECLNL